MRSSVLPAALGSGSGCAGGRRPSHFCRVQFCSNSSRIGATAEPRTSTFVSRQPSLIASAARARRLREPLE